MVGGKNKTMERFNTDEECRCLCIDEICNEYGLSLDSVEHIQEIDNFIKTFHYLKNRGLVVEGYIDKRLLINPKYLIYLTNNNIKCERRFFDLPSEKCIFMYYTTAKVLYGINERWTHCICEIYNKGERRIFDSYWNQLQKEYDQIIFPDHDSLKNKLVIALKIKEE